VKSRCFDASKLFLKIVFVYGIKLLIVDFSLSFTGLVIDGTICYPFNDGTKAFLEVLPEDALLTMKIVD